MTKNVRVGDSPARSNPGNADPAINSRQTIWERKPARELSGEKDVDAAGHRDGDTVSEESVSSVRVGQNESRGGCQNRWSSQACREARMPQANQRNRVERPVNLIRGGLFRVVDDHDFDWCLS